MWEQTSFNPIRAMRSPGLFGGVFDVQPEPENILDTVLGRAPGIGRGTDLAPTFSEAGSVTDMVPFFSQMRKKGRPKWADSMMEGGWHAIPQSLMPMG